MTMRKQRPDESPDEYLCYQGEQSFARGERRRRQRERDPGDFFDVMDRGGMPDKHSPQIALLHTLAKHPFTRDAFVYLRTHLNRLVTRRLMTELGEAELRVWLWVFDRTFNWNKIAEKLPQDRMLHGYRDEQAEGGFQMEDGLPISSGCGVKQPGTIVAALKSLERRSLLDRLEQRKDRHAITFLSPLPVDFAVSFIIGAALEGSADRLTAEGRQRMVNFADRIWLPWLDGQSKRPWAADRPRWEDDAGDLRHVSRHPEFESAFAAFRAASLEREQLRRPEPALRMAA